MSTDLENRGIGTQSQDSLNNFQSLVTTFSDFLIVSIHTILYERGIYPPDTFISTRKYNFPVRQNRHPKVCQWIIEAVAAVEAEMLKGVVDRVAVVIYAPTLEVMERFMFDASSFPEVPPEEALTPFRGHDNNTDKAELNGISVADIEEQLRATVRKLAYCGSKLGPLPKDCTYTIAIELKEKADPPIGHPQPWVPSVPSLQLGKKDRSIQMGKDLGGLKSMPVRSIEAGPFALEMWIEEGKAKLNNAS